MSEMTINSFLKDFSLEDVNAERAPKLNDLVTIRLTLEDKARYDRLQQRSRKRFGKRVREAIIALINAAESSV